MCNPQMPRPTGYCFGVKGLISDFVSRKVSGITAGMDALLPRSQMESSSKAEFLLECDPESLVKDLQALPRKAGEGVARHSPCPGATCHPVFCSEEFLLCSWLPGHCCSHSCSD